MVDKKPYIRRKHYLDILDKNTNAFKGGSGKNIAILGPRKIGKTLLVKDHLKDVKDVIPVYIDLRKISLNPENFSIEFIGNIVFHYLKKPTNEYMDFHDLPRILSEKNSISGSAFFALRTIENELLKIKPNQRLLVELAFDFAHKWAAESSKKFLIILDNFENLLDLNNFSAIGNVLEIVNFNSKNVRYIVTSSLVRQSLKILRDFECFEIKNFDKNEISELVSKITGSTKSSDEIFELSKGHPHIASIISNSIFELKDAKKAFLHELLNKDGQLNHFCEDSYNFYYSRARGQTLLKTILKIIASKDLRLSDIARRVYRSAPVAKSIIERLMDVDIVYKKENKFYISDDAVKLWLNLTTAGLDYEEHDDEKLSEAMKWI